MKKFMKAVVLVAIGFGALGGIAGAMADEAGAGQAKKAIAAANLKFGEAVRQGNSAAVGALYAEDAVLLPPGSEMIKGRPGIQAFWQGGLQMGIKDAVLTSVDVTAFGNTAVEIGTYALKIQPEGQAAVEDHGKYVVVWKKGADGAWRLAVDIWNTSLSGQK
jgi:uncharacterized protein (TIGR02246 family)